MGAKSSKKFAILKLLEEGVNDYELIASKVGCSVRYVQEVARNKNEGSGNLLPAPLNADLVLVNELAGVFDGKNSFAAGVRWLGMSLMFCTRLLGQVYAVPTMGRAGELQELVTLAKAMVPKREVTTELSAPAPKADIALAPSPLEGMMARTMEMLLQNIIGRWFPAAPGSSGAQEPGKAQLPPGWVDLTVTKQTIKETE